MRTKRVVVSSPDFDHGLGLLKRVEDLPVEQLVAQLAVEGFAEAILPRTAGLDIGGLATDGSEPSE